ncbi:MAG: type IV pilus assembly protein PilM [Candidatus Omnitrophota bacterium]
MKIKGLNGFFKDRLAKERFTFGLDIGSRQIKIVKLKLFKDTIELCGLEVASVQLDVGSLLKKFKHSLDISYANVGVCGPSAVIRYVDFPLMSPAELKQSLRFEAQKHVPFSLNEVIIDGYTLRENVKDNKMLLLIAAVKKDLIQQRLKLLDEAGLKVNIIDIDSVALVNAFNHSYAQDEFVKDRSVGLLNIGAALSSLNILENSVPRLSRDIQIAGNNFTQKVVEAFGIDFKAAEELKLNPDDEKKSRVSSHIETILTHLAGEVRVSFDYYESQSAASVSRIFLSGGGSQLSGLKDRLSDLLGIEVQYWDPLRRITISGDMDSQKASSLSTQMAVAVGLALRE